MTKKQAKLYEGHLSHAATASDPHADMNFGSRPVAGQSKAYNSENARGQRQRPTDSDTTAGDAAASGPRQGEGWPARSPSKKY